MTERPADTTRDPVCFDKPVSFNQPLRTLLNDADVSDVAQALLTLTKEVWVLRDRLTLMEVVLKENNIDIIEQLNNYQPDAELQTALDAQSSRLVKQVLNALNGFKEEVE